MKIAREQYEKFNEAFNKVFTTNNEIKNCGREKCEELIDIADLIEKDKKPLSLPLSHIFLPSLPLFLPSISAFKQNCFHPNTGKRFIKGRIFHNVLLLACD